MRVLAKMGIALSITCLVLVCSCGKPDVEPKTAEALTKRILETYSTTARYQDSCTTTLRWKMARETSTITLQTDFAFERPNKVRLVVKHGTFGSSVWCDGTKLYSLLPISKEYVTADAPAKFDNIYVHLPVWENRTVLPSVPRFLTQQKPAEFLLRDVEENRLVGPEKVGGVETHHLHLTYSNGDTRELWAQTSDFLILKERTVSTSNEALGLTSETPAGTIPLEIVYQHKTIKRPRSFPPATWTVDLPEGAEEVRRFSLDED